MPYCSIHPQRKLGICYSCSNYKCCNPTKECTNKNSHQPYRGTWKHIPTKSPVRKRKRTQIRSCRRIAETRNNIEEPDDSGTDD